MAIDVIRNNLRRPVLSAQQRAKFSTVIAASVRDEETIGEFSAFVVEVPIVDAESEFVVVSARHCVTAAYGVGAKVVLRVPIQPEHIDPANPPYVWNTESILVCGWAHDDNTDVSVAPLPLECVPPNHFISSWTRGAFVGGPLQIFRDDVLIFGRGVLGDRSLVIRRRGALATHEAPFVSLEIEPNTFRSVRAYIVEANVTAGMSGGLVIWTNGAGLAENVALGLVHGYAYSNRFAPPAWAHGVEDDAARDAFAKVQIEIEAARNELVYVIPGGELLPLIDRVAVDAARARGNANAQVHPRLW